MELPNRRVLLGCISSPFLSWWSTAGTPPLVSPCLSRWLLCGLVLLLVVEAFWNPYAFVFWEARFIGKVISFIRLFGSFGKNRHSCGVRVPSLHLFSACLVFPCLKALLRESRPAHFVLFGCYIFFQSNRENTCTCVILWRVVFFCGDLCACFSKIQNKNNKTNFRPNICILAPVYGNLTASRFFGKSPGLIWSTSLFLRGKIKICFTSYIRGREKPYGEQQDICIDLKMTNRNIPNICKLFLVLLTPPTNGNTICIDCRFWIFLRSNAVLNSRPMQLLSYLAEFT